MRQTVSPKTMATLALGGALAAALAGCDLRSDDEAGNTPAQTPAGAAAAGGEADLTPEAAGIFDRLFNNGQPMQLGMSQNHANGAVVTLNSIQVKPTETVVNFTVVNGHTRNIALARNDKGSYLTSGGRQFFLVPPIDNQRLEVASGETMTGDLVFIGAVPEADSLQLIFNGRFGQTQEHASTPVFRFDIPVDQSAWSDDGSKKKSA